MLLFIFVISVDMSTPWFHSPQRVYRRWCVCVCYIGDFWLHPWWRDYKNVHQPNTPLHQRDYTHPLNDILMVNLMEGKSQHGADYRAGTRWRNTSNNPAEIKKRTKSVWRQRGGSNKRRAVLVRHPIIMGTWPIQIIRFNYSSQEESRGSAKGQFRLLRPRHILAFLIQTQDRKLSQENPGISHLILQ